MNNLPDKIQELIFKLLSHPELNNKTIRSIVESISLKKEDVLSYVSWKHSHDKSYGKRLLFGNENFNLYLMSWRKGDFTAIHNHGLTDWGCVCCFGDTTHRLYQEKDKRLNLIRKDVFTNGEHVFITGDLTHLMGNASDEDIFTIHIYGNNTGENNVSDKTKVYLPEQQISVATSGSAYLNIEESLIICSESFPDFGPNVLIDYLHLVKPFFKKNGWLGRLQSIEENRAE